MFIFDTTFDINLCYTMILRRASEKDPKFKIRRRKNKDFSRLCRLCSSRDNASFVAVMFSRGNAVPPPFLSGERRPPAKIKHGGFPLAGIKYERSSVDAVRHCTCYFLAIIAQRPTRKHFRTQFCHYFMSKTHHPNIYCKYFNRGHKILLTLCCFVSALAFVVCQFLIYTKNCGCLHVHIQRFIYFKTFIKYGVKFIYLPITVQN